MPHPTQVVTTARQWIGTPYHHQASRKHVGCDCLGLVRGIYRELGGIERETVPAYTADWAEASGRETLLCAAQRHLVALSTPAPLHAGQIIIFRLRPDTMAKHAAILSSSASMIHACEHAGVVEVPLSSWWHRRIAGQFCFPETLLWRH